MDTKLKLHFLPLIARYATTARHIQQKANQATIRMYIWSY